MKDAPTTPSGSARSTTYPYPRHPAQTPNSRPPSAQRARVPHAHRDFDRRHPPSPSPGRYRSQFDRELGIDHPPRPLPSAPTTGGRHSQADHVERVADHASRRHSQAQADRGEHVVDHASRRYTSTPNPEAPEANTHQASMDESDQGDIYHDAPTHRAPMEEPDQGGIYHDAPEWQRGRNMNDQPGSSAFGPSSYSTRGLHPSSPPQPSSDPHHDQGDQRFDSTESQSPVGYYGSQPEEVLPSQGASSDTLGDLIDLTSEGSGQGEAGYPQHRRTSPLPNLPEWSDWDMLPADTQQTSRSAGDHRSTQPPSAAWDQRVMQQAIVNLTQAFQNVSQSQAAVNFAVQNLTQSQSTVTAAMQSLCQVLLQK